MIGRNLKEFLLMMFNYMKDKIFIPKCLRTAHVKYYTRKTAEWIWPIGGAYLFAVFYETCWWDNRIYVNVDESMTDSHVGARKKKCEESSVCIKFFHKRCHELCEKGGNSFKCGGLQRNVWCWGTCTLFWHHWYLVTW